MNTQLCRSCGQMIMYPLPDDDQPWPEVQCGCCGHSTRRRGVVTSRDRRQAAMLAAAQGGPMVMVQIGGQRRPVPLVFLMALMAEEGQQRSNAAGAADIAALPTHTLAHTEALGNQTCCPVCIDDFKDGDDLKTLPCLHIYHNHCIDSWLERDNSCPVCKTPIGRQ